jgi:hypothetical protein
MKQRKATYRSGPDYEMIELYILNVHSVIFQASKTSKCIELLRGLNDACRCNVDGLRRNAKKHVDG